MTRRSTSRGRSSVNAPCPCGSGRKLKKCCGRIHRGVPAATPEELMRARYSAFATGAVAFIVRSAHPSHPQRADPTQREGIARFARDTDFLSLRVLEASQEGDRGEVSFFASLERDGQDVSFGERSRFVRVDGRWLYLDGAPIDRPKG